MLALVPLAWFGVAVAVRRPVRVWRWAVNTPTPAVAARQILTGALDWGLAAGVLYVLMPEAISGGFGHFLAIFVVAQMAGLISHVPGGLGVFEAVMLAGFGATGNHGLEAPILGSLAAFRLVYYLLPLCVATVMVIWREISALRHAAMVTPWFSSLLPPFFAGLTLVCGAVLLFSGATLAIPGRMEILRGFVPLPLVEVSHFLSSVVGMLLLILARGLQRRLDAAYVLTLVLLILGAILSLLKGIDYEEATLLSCSPSPWRPRTGTSTGARRCSAPASRPAGCWRSAPCWPAPRGWCSSASSTSNTATTCGGNSAFITVARRVPSARWWARRRW